MNINISPPPEITGAHSLRELHTYLFNLSEVLNASLNCISEENLAPETAEKISKSEKSAEESAGQYNSLKALIIKTADIVRSEMAELEAHMSATYVAESEFGEYRREAQSAVTATANDITQLYELTETARAEAERVGSSLTDYRMETSQYIKTGYLYDETVDGVSYPRYGLGVGENLTSVNADGQSVYNASNLLATFTSDKLTFWINGTEQAYFRNKKLYVSDAEFSGTVIQGKWRTDTENGYTIRWIGQEANI